MKHLLWLLVVPAQLVAQAPRIPGAVKVDSAHAEAFRVDYVKVVACTGLERSFEALTWYIVPGGSFRDEVQERLGEQKIRYWGETIMHAGTAHDTIFIAQVRPEWVVRHELVHYVRQSIDHDEMLNHKCQAPLSQKILDDEERARQALLHSVARK